jgi:hypothetical protein
MGKTCGICGRKDLPKQFFEAKGRKKKGKQKCNGCISAGGNCVALSAAGFELAGIPGDHEMAIHNGIYSKLPDKMEGDRHVYSGSNGSAAWYVPAGGFWNIGPNEVIGKETRFPAAKSLAASPELISNDSVWHVSDFRGGITGELVTVTMGGITTTALTCQALATAKETEARTFDNAIEQAAPSFVLSGLNSNHERADMMGEYERQDEREKRGGRFVYEGPNGWWARSSEIGSGRCWNFGVEEAIGTGRGTICVMSPAPVPESIQNVTWHLFGKDKTMYCCKLTTTAVHHKPTQLFKGQCELCVHCCKWRRCGRCNSGAMYCSVECQQAHLQAGHSVISSGATRVLA